MRKLLLSGILMCAIVACQNETLTDNVLPNGTEQVDNSESILVRGVAGSTEVQAPQGTYAEIPQEASEWLSEGVSQTRAANNTLVFDLTANTTRQERTAVVALKDAATGETVKIIKLIQTATALNAGDVLIEEIFFTSNLVASTGKPDKAHGDQYVKITNNTKGTLDISGLMLMEAKVNSSLDYHYFDSLTVLPSYAPVQTVYCIPDTLSTLAAGASIIIANNAQNHKATNSNSFDLSGATFEWYDNSTVASMQDIDNPSVPNLDIWFTYTKSIWILHDRGFQGVAIAMPPVGTTKDEFLANYKWEGQYKFYNANNSTWYTMNITNAYKIPNAWVIDAVNLGVPSVWKHNSFNSSLDAGYTSCGTIDMDPDRYGKSVIRKRNRLNVLQDTNNSNDDFTSNATPSLAAN